MPRRKTHPGTIRKRGATWEAALRVKGMRHYYTVEADSLSDVEDFARDKHGELVEQAKRKGAETVDGRPFSAFLAR